MRGSSGPYDPFPRVCSRGENSACFVADREVGWRLTRRGSPREAREKTRAFALDVTSSRHRRMPPSTHRAASIESFAKRCHATTASAPTHLSTRGRIAPGVFFRRGTDGDRRPAPSSRRGAPAAPLACPRRDRGAARERVDIAPPRNRSRPEFRPTAIADPSLQSSAPAGPAIPAGGPHRLQCLRRAGVIGARCCCSTGDGRHRSRCRRDRAVGDNRDPSRPRCGPGFRSHRTDRAVVSVLSQPW
jgi:hypothetical protein